MSQDHHGGVGNDAFLPYRDRIVYSLALASLVIFLPFAVNNFLQGRLALGVATLFIVLILAIDGLAVYRGRPLPIPLWLLVLPVLASMVLTVLAPLYIGLAWAYPFLILFYFVLPQRVAIVLSVLIIVTVTGLSWYWFPMVVTTRIGATLTLTAVLANIFVDIISQLHRQVCEQATRDPMTGAFNRRHMDTVFSEVIARSARGAQPPAALFLDIDHFKRINDQYGHAAGDAAIKRLVAIVGGKVRRIDTLFRCGGEEFILLLPETSLEGAAVAAEEIRRLVEGDRTDGVPPMTVSIGVSRLRAGETMDDWIRRGDRALYEAKSAGRNCVAMEAAGQLRWP